MLMVLSQTLLIDSQENVNINTFIIGTQFILQSPYEGVQLIT